MRGEDAYKEDYEHIELFDEPGLFTNSRIDRETVPAGWYCYDLRGNDDDPGDPTTVEEQVTVNHAGTVLLPKALKLNKTDIDGTRYRIRRRGEHRLVRHHGALGRRRGHCHRLSR